MRVAPVSAPTLVQRLQDAIPERAYHPKPVEVVSAFSHTTEIGALSTKDALIKRAQSLKPGAAAVIKAYRDATTA